MILKNFDDNKFGTNNYLLIDEKSKEAVLFDATGNIAQEIIQPLEEYGAKLKYLIITHGHIDHIESSKDVEQKFNVPVLIGSQEGLLINNLSVQSTILNVGRIESPNFQLVVDENYPLSIGEYKIAPIHTPGHTLGGLSYLVDGMLFSGDTLFYEEIGRCDLPGGSFKEIEKSIREKLFTLPEQTVVYPGHGMASTVGHEKEYNAYFGRRAAL